MPRVSEQVHFGPTDIPDLDLEHTQKIDIFTIQTNVTPGVTGQTDPPANFKLACRTNMPKYI